MDQLRQEILEAERARSDLLKWKLILVAAIGTVGLGFNESEIGHPLVLVGIPLVCAYVDLLCRHLTLRIHVIGHFMRKRPEQSLFRDYEAFAEDNENAFAFEGWALVWSSVLLSAAVVAYGAYLFHNPNGTTAWTRAVLIGAGVLGVLLAVVVDRTYVGRKTEIGERRAGRGVRPRGSGNRWRGTTSRRSRFMAVTAKPETGTKDKNYDLITVTYLCLEHVWRLDQYAQDAEREGDEELATLFRRMQEHSRRGAEESKRLLSQRLQEDT